MKTVLIALSLALLLLVSCAPKAKVAPPPVAPVAPVGTDQAVSEIESSVAEIEQLEQELDISELDQLEQDLAELDALDLG